MSGEAGNLENHPFDPHIKYRCWGENLTRGYDLPPQLAWVGEWANDHFSDLVDKPFAFHGTRMSRIRGIRNSGGLRAFPEYDWSGKLIAHDIFGTADPTLAAWHAYTNGPEDTNTQRLIGQKSTRQDDPVVVLCIDVRNPYFQAKTSKLEQELKESFVEFVDSPISPAVERAIPLGTYIPIECISVLANTDGNIQLKPFSECFK